MAGLSFYFLSNSILVVHLVHYCQSRLIGPNQPIIATAGEDITLPCHLVPGVNVAAVTLEWTKPDMDPRFVFLWRAVKPADEGRYRCYIPDKNEEAFIDLLVASSAVSSPDISLEGIDRDKTGVMLECKSEGWHPEPELLWLDGEGNHLSAGPTETLRGPDDLYTVSSRVTVEKRHSNNITCRVQQRNTNQSRETHIHVSDEFFELTSSSAPVIIGLAVSLAISIILILTGVFYIWRQNKTNVRRAHCDACKEQETTTPLNPSKFQVLPFWLCNAPAIFQRLMNSVLAGLIYKTCAVYLDDIVIASPTFEQHLVDLEEVLGRLQAAGLSLKLKKCQFCLDEFTFLRYRITSSGVKPDLDKVKVVKEFDTPTSVKHVCQFLGLHCKFLVA
ncbi:butyrophilin subfamily 3 member A2-like isoform X1 [Oreochromis aureus]|uniref:butyrophilin subfamily 3 member A2-like isoform X1 n=1 Tax=Oreochromis aureus TaxID=47969 RepID=UPI0019543217|nr:butyrophilin subfamily 3 member A2-like isoform X1 [Oreochromis aureus]